MRREDMLSMLNQQKTPFDIIIIGGGASGIGIALEAVTRGYQTLLLEKSDFTKSTSSKSTKLVHGGVRYMAQGDLALVIEACTERARLLKNAPHLAQMQSFVIPAFGWFDEVFYTIGLKFYDLLAGRNSLGRSRRLSKSKTLDYIPTIDHQKITGGIQYFDGQFDDSRLAVNVLKSASDYGALVLNYAEVTGLKKDDQGIVSGVRVRDLENGTEYVINGRAVINATGVFADDIMQMELSGQARTIRPSQGVHIVLDKTFLPGDHAIMIPKTDDGRVLFAVPWHGKVVVGTTDTPVNTPDLEPVALEEEIRFILNTAGKYLNKQPERKDVFSVFAGLRPLAASKGEKNKTREISRSHKIIVSDGQLFTMIGGKWTTFRKMADDMVQKVERVKGWRKTKTKTKNLKLDGYTTDVDTKNPLYVYGCHRKSILKLAETEGLNTKVSESLGIITAQVVWAVREEMARTVEDVLARRTRCLTLDARESIRMAPAVAQIMAKELNRNRQWEQEQIIKFQLTAEKYILH